jgi:hypothetical protein
MASPLQSMIFNTSATGIGSARGNGIVADYSFFLCTGGDLTNKAVDW